MPRCRQSPPSRIEKPFCLSALTAVPRLYFGVQFFRFRRTEIVTVFCRKHGTDCISKFFCVAGQAAEYDRIFFLIHSKSLLSDQIGIGVRAIRMTARIAPTNAAAPMTANTFLLVFFFAALQIRAAQATQTAAAISAMPSVSHNHDNSLIQFITSPVFLHSLPDALSPLRRISYRCSAAAYKRAGCRKTAGTSRTSLGLRL